MQAGYEHGDRGELLEVLVVPILDGEVVREELLQNENAGQSLGVVLLQDGLTIGLSFRRISSEP